jgi:hypothetical protein
VLERVREQEITGDADDDHFGGDARELFANRGVIGAEPRAIDRFAQ